MAEKQQWEEKYELYQKVLEHSDDESIRSGKTLQDYMDEFQSKDSALARQLAAIADSSSNEYRQINLSRRNQREESNNTTREIRFLARNLNQIKMNLPLVERQRENRDTYQEILDELTSKQAQNAEMIKYQEELSQEATRLDEELQELKEIEEHCNIALNNPNATPEQKEHAARVLQENRAKQNKNQTKFSENQLALQKELDKPLMEVSEADIVELQEKIDRANKICELLLEGRTMGEIQKVVIPESKNQGKQGQGQGKQDQGQEKQDQGQGKQDQGQGKQDQGQGKQDQGQGKQDQGQGKQDQGQGKQDQGQGKQDQGQGKQDQGQEKQDQGQEKQDQGQGKQDQGQNPTKKIDTYAEEIYGRMSPSQRNEMYKFMTGQIEELGENTKPLFDVIRKKFGTDNGNKIESYVKQMSAKEFLNVTGIKTDVTTGMITVDFNCGEKFKPITVDLRKLKGKGTQMDTVKNIQKTIQDLHYDSTMSDPYTISAIYDATYNQLVKLGLDGQIYMEDIQKQVDRYQKALRTPKCVKPEDKKLDINIEYAKSHEKKAAKVGRKKFEKVLRPFLREAQESTYVEIDDSIDTRTGMEKIKDTLGAPWRWITGKDKLLSAGRKHEGKYLEENDRTEGKPEDKAEDAELSNVGRVLGLNAQINVMKNTPTGETVEGQRKDSNSAPEIKPAEDDREL